MTQEVRIALQSGPGFEAALRAVKGRVWALERGPGNGDWVALVYVDDGQPEPVEVAKPSKTIFGRAKKSC